MGSSASWLSGMWNIMLMLSFMVISHSVKYFMSSWTGSSLLVCFTSSLWQEDTRLLDCPPIVTPGNFDKAGASHRLSSAKANSAVQQRFIKLCGFLVSLAFYHFLFFFCFFYFTWHLVTKNNIDLGWNITSQLGLFDYGGKQFQISRAELPQNVKLFPQFWVI